MQEVNAVSRLADSVASLREVAWLVPTLALNGSKSVTVLGPCFHSLLGCICKGPSYLAMSTNNRAV